MSFLRRILISIIVSIVLLIGAVQFPKLFIKKAFTYKAFTLYSNDQLDLNESVKNILDSVQSNLKHSEFHRENLKLELYFVQGSLYEKLIALFGMNNIASSKFNKHIYTGKPIFDQNVLKKGSNSIEWLNLIQIISHEGAHSQMYKDHSIVGFMKTPSWINEGYAEYISYKPIRENQNYFLSELFIKYESANDFWVKTEFGSMTPKLYLRDRILIEYLIDIRKMDILSIIEDQSLKPEMILEEMKEHFEKTE